MVELVHTKLNTGKDMAGNDVYQLDLAFGTPFTDANGRHIGKTKVIHMGMMNGMPPEDFIIGLHALAEHIQATIVDSTDFDEKPDLTVVENNSG